MTIKLLRFTTNWRQELKKPKYKKNGKSKGVSQVYTVELGYKEIDSYSEISRSDLNFF